MSKIQTKRCVRSEELIQTQVRGRGDPAIFGGGRGYGL
jgi:hypothetical protein